MYLSYVAIQNISFLQTVAFFQNSHCIFLSIFSTSASSSFWSLLPHLMRIHAHLKFHWHAHICMKKLTFVWPTTYLTACHRKKIPCPTLCQLLVSFHLGGMFVFDNTGYSWTLWQPPCSLDANFVRSTKLYTVKLLASVAMCLPVFQEESCKEMREEVCQKVQSGNLG